MGRWFHAEVPAGAVDTVNDDEEDTAVSFVVGAVARPVASDVVKAFVMGVLAEVACVRVVAGQWVFRRVEVIEQGTLAALGTARGGSDTSDGPTGLDHP